MTAHNWLVFTGHGLQLHSAHATLAEAFDMVYREIAIIHEWRLNTQRDDCETDGQPRLYYWDCPTRPMTREEIDACEHPENVKRSWRKMPPNTSDFDAADRQGVTFRGERFSHVSICREDRHREYLARASMLNDKRADVAEVDHAVAALA